MDFIGRQVKTGTDELLRARFVFLDGASASGKSTMKNLLLADRRFHFVYARRHTSRAPRPGDSENDDYIFITGSEFQQMREHGNFAEYRDFRFGMSYGVSKEELAKCAKESDQVLALMNLGSVKMLRRTLPESICILIDAPVREVERRLRARGVHTPDQVSERVANAETVKQLASEYDFVLANKDGALEHCYETLVRFLNGRMGTIDAEPQLRRSTDR